MQQHHKIQQDQNTFSLFFHATVVSGKYQGSVFELKHLLFVGAIDRTSCR